VQWRVSPRAKNPRARLAGPAVGRRRDRNLLRRAQKIATADSRLYKISHVSGTLHSDGELRLIYFQASSMADDDKPNRQRTIARPALTSEPRQIDIRRWEPNQIRPGNPWVRHWERNGFGGASQ